jgi:glucokinase
LAAAAGDLRAAEIFVAAGRALGIAAATVVNLLNIEAIVVGGGVAASFPLFAVAMDAEMRARAFKPAVSSVRILKGELGDDAGLLGAAALALQEVHR